MARVLQGVGGAMMVPVGRLTVMKIVPRAQYMAAMTFVTLPGQVGPLLGPALGGILVEYASGTGSSLSTCRSVLSARLPP